MKTTGPTIDRYLPPLLVVYFQEVHVVYRLDAAPCLPLILMLSISRLAYLDRTIGRQHVHIRDVSMLRAAIERRGSFKRLKRTRPWLPFHNRSTHVR
jgi:hypothetical protein